MPCGHAARASLRRMLSKPRLSAVVRPAIAKVQAGVSPDDVAADLIRKRADGVVFRVRLPQSDPRQPIIETLARAIGARTVDDSALSLKACLRDFDGAENLSG